ncbi:MAG: HEAT repeat domain-containing protein [Chloroflexota bacterium]|nr:MAG: HEAT repeat domain-containing protein [Chloroflexota bacterium]
MSGMRSKSTKNLWQVRPARADQIARLVTDLGSEDGRVRHQSRLALVEIGAPAVRPLIAALADPQENVRWEAAKALGEIGDPSAASALVNALEDKSFGVRWLAAEGLIALKQYALAPLLLALTKRSSSVWLRRGAHHVLHDLSMRGFRNQVAPVLEALEDVEPLTEVPLAAWTTLERLAGTHRYRGRA